MVKRRGKSGFTITELLVVIIILGIIVAFAMPNFDSSRDRAVERSAALQLQMVRNAMKLYFSRNGITQLPNTGYTPDYDVQRLHRLLNISVTEPESLTFGCYDTNGGDINNCQFVHTDGWIVEFHNTANVVLGSNIHCEDNSCPFCNVEGGGGCPY